VYCAFWINPTDPSPNRRVVLVRPHKDQPPWVKAPGAAWAILRSAIHEERTGCIVAGTTETLPACIAAIEKEDQHWPADPDRMVAAITALATLHNCTVIFRQNLKPGGPEPAPGASVGQAIDTPAGPQWTVVGPADSVVATLQLNPHCCLVERVSDQRAKIGLVDLIEAARPETSDSGSAMSCTLSVKAAEDVLDFLLSAPAKYRFALLVKDKSHSIVFLGTKQSVGTCKAAIQCYVEHLIGEPEKYPDGSAESTEFLETSPQAPKVADCRFWKLPR